MTHIIDNAHHTKRDAQFLGKCRFTGPSHPNNVKVIFVQADLCFCFEPRTNCLKVGALANGFQSSPFENLNNRTAHLLIQLCCSFHSNRLPGTK